MRITSSARAIGTLGIVDRIAIGLPLCSASFKRRKRAEFNPFAKATAAMDTPGCWHAPLEQPPLPP